MADEEDDNYIEIEDDEEEGGDKEVTFNLNIIINIFI